MSGAARAGLLGAAALLVTLSPAAAQNSKPAASSGGDQPIEITSDKLVLEQNQRIATFTGNVDAIQGDTTLRTDLLRVFYTSEEERQTSGSQKTVRLLEAEGNVVIIQPGETAQGNTGNYDLAAGKMVLLGDVVLTRGKNVVKGDRLDVDRNTGVSVVSMTKPVGDAAHSPRVRALFVPEPKPAQP